LKVKKILVTQPKPEGNEKSPYQDLIKNYNVTIDYCPFIQVEGVTPKEFRRSKVNVLDHTAVIFTSKTAVDHFFRLCQELRVVVPDTMKYFCVTETIAFYLQRYIIYRKRKIFFGKNKFEDLLEMLNKHRDEKFLVPLSDIHKQEIPKKLTKLKLTYTKAVLYKTVSACLAETIPDIKAYDIVVFYSPQGIKALFDNFTGFIQDNTKIAAFGPTTIKAAKDAGLKVDIAAPTTVTPSMSMALDVFLKKVNKENGKSA